MKNPFTNPTTVCLLLTLLAFVLRLTGLTRYGLWYDETFSQIVSTTNWDVFWIALLSDAVHPPGYYLLLRVTIPLIGDSEFALRFISVAAGTLAVPLIYQLGRILGNKSWGLAAALLLTINPFALWYSQEARMYSLLLPFAIATSYAFWRFAQHATWTRWLWLTLLLAGGFALHYFAFFLSLIQFVYIVFDLRRTFPIIRRWILAQFAAFIPFAFWALAVANREGGTFGIGWINPVSPLDIPLTLPNLAFVLADSLWAWAGLILLLVAIVAGYFAIKQLRFRPRKAMMAAFKFLLIWLILPPILVWAMSLKLPLYVDRHLIIILPALLLLASMAVISKSNLAYGLVLGLAIVSIVGCVRLFLDTNFAKEDWRGAAAYIVATEEPGDALIMQNFQNQLAFSYYYNGNLELETSVVNQDITPMETLSEGHKRAWVVYRRPFEPTHALAGSQPFTWRNDPDPVNLNWLQARESSIIEEITLPGVHIVLLNLSQ